MSEHKQLTVAENFDITALTTFGVPVKARFYAEVGNAQEIVRLWNDCRFASLPKFVLGGGSNVLFTKDFDGLVIRPVMDRVEVVDENDAFTFVRAQAGMVWDELVEWSLELGLNGLENLAAVPGSVGGAAVQNIGAYGVEVAERIAEVECLDPVTGAISVVNVNDCDYGYRTSAFKTSQMRNLVVLSVTFALSKVFEPVMGYKELEHQFAGKTPASARELAQAIRAIRARKLPDPKVLGSAGSFFKNPVVDKVKLAHLLADEPRLVSYPLAGSRAKLAAGWLIDSVGLKGARRGDAGVYERQALVLVNHGNATGAQIKELADEVAKAVWFRFGVTLTPEPVIL